MNIHVRRQVPLRLFQLTEPAGLVPSWLTTQGTQQHVWPSCSPSVTRLACTSRAQSKSRPSGWGGDTNGSPHWEKATKPIKSPGLIPESQL